MIRSALARSALSIITKAGGFGEPDLFVSMLLAVAARGGVA